MLHTETPDPESVNYDNGLLTITFANGETYQWKDVPANVAKELEAEPTFHKFAVLIRPHYKMRS